MRRKTLKLIYLAIGWITVGLAIIGTVLPVMPTVPFLIVSLWAFSRSSERFHNWLYTHKTYGPLLRDWDKYRVVPIWGKIWSSAAMTGSLLMLIFWFKSPWWVVVITGCCMALIATYIISKPSRRPADVEGDAGQPAD